MNLFASILTSIIIMLAVWFGVIYQPTPAYADIITPSTTEIIAESMANDDVEEISEKSKLKSEPKVKEKYQSTRLISKNNSVKNNAPVANIVGVSQEMLISDIDKLWAKFSQRGSLHSQLSDYPTATYVLYRNISKSFTRADITIGYDSRELTSNSQLISLPTGHYQTVITDSHLSSKQLEAAWKKLNFTKEVVAVVERHQLNKRAEVVSVSMQVLYK